MTATNWPSGNATSCRAGCARARPRRPAHGPAAGRRRRAGTSIRRRPDRYAPVTDSADALQVGDGPADHDLPALLARPRADVDDPVRGPDGVLVVLHDDQRVAQVAQPQQRLDQLPVVPRVQARPTARPARTAPRPAPSRAASRAGSAAPRRRQRAPPPGPATGSPARRRPGSPAGPGSPAAPARRSAPRARSAPGRSATAAVSPTGQRRDLRDRPAAAPSRPGSPAAAGRPRRPGTAPRA